MMNKIFNDKVASNFGFDNLKMAKVKSVGCVKSLKTFIAIALVLCCAWMFFGANLISYSVNDAIASEIFTVTYDANNGGTFSNGTSQNLVMYEQTKVLETKISKTSNVLEDGTQLYPGAEYGNNVYSTDTVRVEGATELKVTITYQTENINYDWVCVYDGSVTPSSSNYSSSISGKLGDQTKTTKTYTIQGDTVQFFFRSDSSVSNYYGYYAVIEYEKVDLNIASGTVEIPEPLNDEMNFMGWYTDSSCTAGNEFTEEDISSDMTVYAKFDISYVVTYNANGGTFANGKTQNVVVHMPNAVTEKKISKTANIDDDGVQTGGYPKDAFKEVLTFPGAKSLKVTIKYQTYDSYDWVAIYDGNVEPSTSNTAMSVSGKLYGGRSYSTPYQSTYTITGDTVQFLWRSDSGSQYGYYAVVEGVYTPAYAGAYENPKFDENHKFVGWYTDPECTEGNEFDPASITSNITVYAKYDEYLIASGIIEGCSWKIKGDGTLIVYPTDGISGMLDHNDGWIRYNNTGNYKDFYSVQFWGPYKDYILKAVFEDGVIGPSNMSYLFYNCAYLTEVDFSGLDGSGIENVNNFFNGCQNLAIVSGLDIKNATNLQNMFSGASVDRNLTLRDFDVSNVVDMSYMFANSSFKSLDLDNFDCSSVTNMSYMFNKSQLESFELGSLLNTQNVTNMSHMFEEGKLKDIDCSNSNTSGVTDMSYMFQKCYSLETLNLTGLDTSKVETMESMFQSCGASTVDISGLDTSSVKSMKKMFQSTTKLKTLNLGNLNTSSLTDMNCMFAGSALVSVDVGGLDTENVTDMHGLFSECKSLSKIENLNAFDTQNVTDMSSMFYHCKYLSSIDVSSFDTSNVTNMESMFEASERYTWGLYQYGYSSALKTLDLSNFDTSNVTNMRHMFWGLATLVSLDISGFDTSNVTDMIGVFGNCEALPILDVSGFDTSNVLSMNSMFYDCASLQSLDVSNFDTRNVTSMAAMFHGCASLTSLDVSNFDTSNVTNMASMFKLSLIQEQAPHLDYQNGEKIIKASKLTKLDLSNFNTSKVTGMSSMFANTPSLKEINLSSFDTSKVSTMAEMFRNCGVIKLDLSSFDTSEVYTMEKMFENCGVIKLDLSGFDTSSVTSMSYMFKNTPSLISLDVSSFNTSNVTSLIYAFNNCGAKDLDVSNFDTSNVTNMDCAFMGCKANVLDLSGFNTSKVTSMQSMLSSIAATKLVFGSSFNFVGTGYNTAYLSGNNWVKVRSANGNKTYDTTEYTGEQILKLNNIDTTPLLAGTWAKYGVENYVPNPDGTVEFVSIDSDWVMLSDNIWTYTFEVFDDTLIYNLFEEVMDGYISEAMSPYYIVVYDGKATLTNTAAEVEKGRLIISKTVEGTETTEDFEILITLNGEGFEGNQIFSGVIFDNGVGKLLLKDGEQKIIDLPIGTTYLIEETPNKRYESTIINKQGEIAPNETIGVNVINTYISGPDIDPLIADIVLKKTISDNCKSNTSFTILAYFTNLESNSVYNLSNGEKIVSNSEGIAFYTANLKGNEEITFHGLSAGAKYQFTETENAYTAAVTVRDISSVERGIVKQMLQNTTPNTALSTDIHTLEENEKIEVCFYSDSSPLQDLIVSNIVQRVENGETTDYETYEKDFEFTITFSNMQAGSSFTSDIGVIVGGGDGTASKTFMLNHGQTVKFYDIPENIKYQITESNSEFIVSYNIQGQNVVKDSGMVQYQNISTAVETIDANEENIVKFQNIDVKQSLSVSKVLKERLADGTFVDYVDENAEFGFIVEFSNATAGSIIISEAGNVTIGEDGTAIKTFMLKNGESVKFENIPVDSQYRVIEIANKYIPVYEIEGLDVIKRTNVENNDISTMRPYVNVSTETETLNTNESDHVTFTSIEAKQTLTVSHITHSTEGSVEEEFPEIPEDEQPYCIKIMTDKGGYLPEAIISVGFYVDGEYVEEMIPVGALKGILNCRDVPSTVIINVVSIPVGYTAVTEPITVTLVDGKPSVNEIVLFNKIEEEFEVVVDFSNVDRNYVIKSSLNEELIANENGEISQTYILKDGEFVNFENIPVGATYRVTEKATNSPNGYVGAYHITQGIDIKKASNIAIANGEIDIEDVPNLQTNVNVSTKTETFEMSERANVVLYNFNTQQLIYLMRSSLEELEDGSTDAILSDEEFEVIVNFANMKPNASISYISGNEETGDMGESGMLIADENGTIAHTFMLKSADIVAFINVPIGTTYQFAEKAKELEYDYAGYYLIEASVKANKMTNLDFEDNQPIFYNLPVNVDVSTEVEVAEPTEMTMVQIGNVKLYEPKQILMMGNQTVIEFFDENEEITNEPIDEDFEYAYEFGNMEPNAEIIFAKVTQEDMMNYESLEEFLADQTPIYADENGEYRITISLKSNIQEVVYVLLPVDATYKVTQVGKNLFESMYMMQGPDGEVLKDSDTASFAQNLSTEVETLSRKEINELIFQNIKTTQSVTVSHKTIVQDAETGEFDIKEATSSGELELPEIPDEEKDYCIAFVTDQGGYLPEAVISAGFYMDGEYVESSIPLGELGGVLSCREAPLEFTISVVSTPEGYTAVTEPVTITVTDGKPSVSELVLFYKEEVVEEEEFEIVIHFENLIPDSIVKSSIGEDLVADENGTITKSYMFKNGESVEFTDVPVGATYKVTEKATDSANGYVGAYIYEKDGELETNFEVDENGEPVFESVVNLPFNVDVATEIETVEKYEAANVAMYNVETVQELTLARVSMEELDDGEMNPLLSDNEFEVAVNFANMKPNAPISYFVVNAETEELISEGEMIADANGAINHIFLLKAFDVVHFENVPIGATYQFAEKAKELDYDYAGFYMVQAEKVNQMTNMEIDQNGEPIFYKLPVNVDVVTEIETAEPSETAVVVIGNIKVAETQQILWIGNDAGQDVEDEDGNVNYEELDEEFEYVLEFGSMEANAEIIIAKITPEVEEMYENLEDFITSQTPVYADENGEYTTTMTLMSNWKECIVVLLPTDATYKVTQKAKNLFIPAYEILGSDDFEIVEKYVEAEGTQDLATETETLSRREENEVCFYNIKTSQSLMVLHETLKQNAETGEFEPKLPIEELEFPEIPEEEQPYCIKIMTDKGGYLPEAVVLLGYSIDGQHVEETIPLSELEGILMCGPEVPPEFTIRTLMTPEGYTAASEPITITVTDGKPSASEIVLFYKDETYVEEFEVTVRLENLQPNSIVNYVIGGMTVGVIEEGEWTADENGVINQSYMLKHYEGIEITDLPAGATYKVTEKPSNSLNGYVGAYICEQDDGLKTNLELDEYGDPDYESVANLPTNVEVTTEVGMIGMSETVQVTMLNFETQQMLYIFRESIEEAKDGSTDTLLSDDEFEVIVNFANVKPNASITYILGNEETGEMGESGTLVAAEDGTIAHTFMLKSADAVIFVNTPIGATYQVTEKAKELPYDYVGYYQIEASVNVNKMTNVEIVDDVPVFDNLPANVDVSTEVEMAEPTEMAMVKIGNIKRYETTQLLMIINQAMRLTIDEEAESGFGYEAYIEEFDYVVDIGNLTPNGKFGFAKLTMDEAESVGELSNLTSMMEVAFANENGEYALNLNAVSNEEVIIVSLPVGATYKATQVGKDFCMAQYVIAVDGEEEFLGNIDNLVVKNEGMAPVGHDVSTEEETLLKTEMNMVQYITAVIDELPEVTINKVDNYGNPVVGAKLQVLQVVETGFNDRDDFEVETQVLYEFETTRDPITINVPPIEMYESTYAVVTKYSYLLHEVEAPAGYETAKDFKFEVHEDGSVVEVVEEAGQETEFPDMGIPDEYKDYVIKMTTDQGGFLPEGVIALEVRMNGEVMQESASMEQCGGILVCEGLPADVTEFTVKAISAPAGYSTAEPVTITLVDGKPSVNEVVLFYKDAEDNIPTTVEGSVITMVDKLNALPEEYTVTVPAQLAPGETGTVTVEGVWKSTRKLQVTADAIVTLHNSEDSSETKDLGVIFEGIDKVGDSTQKVTDSKNITIEDASDMLFGTWTGIFYYDVQLVEDPK